VFLAGGLWQLSRGQFWAGVVVLSAQLASRFFEYQTGLLLKSAMFIGLGVVVLIAGVLFETRRGAGHA
jgi:Zn-dependent membrane protease YugP